MANAKDQACINNAKASVMPDAASSDKQQCPLMKRLRVGVFFDGTNNNRYRDEGTHHETNVDRLYKLYHTNEDEIAESAGVNGCGLFSQASSGVQPRDMVCYCGGHRRSRASASPWTGRALR